jgi:hypothetical protein
MEHTNGRTAVQIFAQKCKSTCGAKAFPSYLYLSYPFAAMPSTADKKSPDTLSHFSAASEEKAYEPSENNRHGLFRRTVQTRNLQTAHPTAFRSGDYFLPHTAFQASF